MDEKCNFLRFLHVFFDELAELAYDNPNLVCTKSPQSRYAFINFVDGAAAARFKAEFNDKKLPGCRRSHKVKDTIE